MLCLIFFRKVINIFFSNYAGKFWNLLKKVKKRTNEKMKKETKRENKKTKFGNSFFLLLFFCFCFFPFFLLSLLWRQKSFVLLFVSFRVQFCLFPFVAFLKIFLWLCFPFCFFLSFCIFLFVPSYPTVSLSRCFLFVLLLFFVCFSCTFSKFSKISFNGLKPQRACISVRATAISGLWFGSL